MVSRSILNGEKNASFHRLRTPKRPFAYAQTTVRVRTNANGIKKKGPAEESARPDVVCLK